MKPQHSGGSRSKLGGKFTDERAPGAAGPSSGASSTNGRALRLNGTKTGRTSKATARAAEPSGTTARARRYLPSRAAPYETRGRSPDRRRLSWPHAATPRQRTRSCQSRRKPLRASVGLAVTQIWRPVPLRRESRDVGQFLTHRLILLPRCRPQLRECVRRVSDAGGRSSCRSGPAHRTLGGP